jgi:hypothetical protein
MLPMRPPLCLYCKRFNPEAFPAKCEAFPTGIPDEIFDGRYSHIKSMRGEPFFEGTIPVGYETIAEPLDEEWVDVELPEMVYSESEESAPARQPDTARGWTPARRI